MTNGQRFWFGFAAGVGAVLLAVAALLLFVQLHAPFR